MNEKLFFGGDPVSGLSGDFSIPPDRLAGPKFILWIGTVAVAGGALIAYYSLRDRKQDRKIP